MFSSLYNSYANNLIEIKGKTFLLLYKPYIFPEINNRERQTKQGKVADSEKALEFSQRNTFHF